VDPADIPNEATGDEEEQSAVIAVIGAERCNRDGTHLLPDYGVDSAERMLLREGIIDEIPPQTCDPDRANKTKNFIMYRSLFFPH
jgi:hypothetical protein